MEQGTPGVIILLYHNILPPGSPPNADQQSIPFDLLLEHIAAMRAAGFECVPLAEAFHGLVRQPAPAGPPQFAVTFDDGYASLHAYLPLLAPCVRPTVFVLTEYAGQSNLAWNTRTPVILRHLSVQQTRKLAEAGVDIELHGMDHHNLLKFDRDELCRRFERGITCFQEQLGRRPRFLAYPYGYCNETVKEVAARYFEGAFSVTHGAWTGEAARHAVNRLSVPSFLSGTDLVAVACAPPEQRWYECERRAPWRARGRAENA